MATQEIYRIAEQTVNTINFDTFEVSVWKEQRVYLNRPNQSKKYQDVGYVRLSDMSVFPAFGITPRTERDRDALKALEMVSDALKAGKAPEAQPKQEFKSLLPW